MWEITRDWEESWNQWKTGCFLTLQTEAMETMAHGLFRRLTRLAKEYKVRWDGTGDNMAPPQLRDWVYSGTTGLLMSPILTQDRNWEIIETTRSKIEQFKRTMPLISDLRNPALRER